MTALTTEAAEYAKGRGISEKTLTAMHVVGGKARFHDGAFDAIVFRYLDHDGEQINYKARSIEGKRYTQAKGGKQAAYNWGHVRDGDLDCVWIVEGEFDALALVEAGIPIDAVISVPGGAVSQESDDPTEGRKYAWLLDAMEEGLSKASRYIIATDNDDPGRALRHDMVRILGKAKTFFVDWPDGIKDANEFLLDQGSENLGRYVHTAAKPWPVEGIFCLSEIPEPGPLELWEVGMPELEGQIRLSPTMVSAVTGWPGHGKALALDTEIRTLGGWSTMGEIRVGDTVYDENGQECLVTAATEVMFGRPCYKITFDDGTTVVADADHQWLTETAKARRSQWGQRNRLPELRPRGTDQSHKRIMPSVVTTKQIAESIKYFGKNNHAIRLCGVVGGGSKNETLPIDPYTLGAWLGDGSAHCAYIHAVDEGIYDEIRKAGYDVVRSNESNWLVRGLKKQLRENGLIRNKHIPEIYKFSSPEARLSLLQGMMDTDGFCHAKDRQCEFTSCNQGLAYGVHEIACSLGIKAKIREGRAVLNGKDCGRKYRVLFTTNKPVFRLGRKLERLGTKAPRSAFRYIVKCEPVPTVPVRCIQVDSASSLFLITRSHIATHNSHLFQQIWFSIARRYGVKIAVFSAETRTKPFLRRNMRQFYWRRLERNQDDRQRREADEFIEEHFLFLDHPSERPTPSWIIDTAEVAVQRHGCRALFIDPWNKLEEDYDPREMNETRWIGRMLDLFIDMSRGLSIHTQIIAHPAKPDATLKKFAPDLYSIAGSAHWNNRVDQGFCIHREKIVEAGKRQTDAELRVLKSRFEELGYPGAHPIRYDTDQGIFMATEFETHAEQIARSA